MPTASGPKHAISVTTEASQVLLSLYALMVNLMILNAWKLVVLLGIAVFARRQNLTRNMGVANVAIWNDPAPLSIVKSMLTYRAHIPMYAFGWASVAILAWAANSAASLLVAPHLILGTAAPANPAMVSVPAESLDDYSSKTLRISSLEVPSNLRAIDILDSINSTTGTASTSANYQSQFNVSVGNTISWVDANGNLMNQVDYSYRLSGNDFGLQRARNLHLDVQGSCRTEYGWYLGGIIDQGIIVDYYNIFGTNFTASVTDSKRPIGTVTVNGTSSGSNITWAVLISSVQRNSFTPGTDPWYLTQTLSGDPVGAGYTVKAGRPPLSCWESNVWSYKGKQKSILDIDQLELLQPAMIAIFQRFLSAPRITSLIQGLDASALKSAATAKGTYFDAGSANLHDDLQHLVLGAYVATKNTLAESVLFNNPYSDIPNLLYNGTTNQLLPGAGDFIINGSDFAALSILVLIVVPILTVLLWATAFVLTGDFLPLPWMYINALKAPVLYSALDVHSSETEENSQWKRTSTPYHEDRGALVQVRPTYDKRSRTLSWASSM